MISILFNGQENLLVLISAFIIGGLFRKHSLFRPFFEWITSGSKDKRFGLMCVSLFSGVLPVEGRVSISAPVLDSLVSKCDCDHTDRRKMGILDFVANHHYYLWSPLESTTIIVMAGLGLTYSQLLGYTLLPLAVYLMYLAWVVYKYVDKYEVEATDAVDFSYKSVAGVIPFIVGIALSILFDPVYIFPLVAFTYFMFWPATAKEVAGYIRVGPIVFVACIIILANIVKANHEALTHLLSVVNDGSSTALVLSLLGAFIASVCLGSSGKYAGIAVALTLAFGIKYLPLILMIEYAGYLISPTHKCLAISASYFNTRPSEFYKCIGTLAVLMVCAGFIRFLLPI